MPTAREPDSPSRSAAPPPIPIDIHQHLWPPELIDALRRRRRPPRIDGWILTLPGEPPYEIDPRDHDPDRRRRLDSGRIVLGLSSPLGIEDLDPDDAAPLLDAWHRGAADLAPRFEAWASVSRLDSDLGALRGLLAAGFAGVQVPATWLAAPADVERLGGVFAVAESAGKPVFVHPGPVPRLIGAGGGRPGWWAAVVDYPTQLVAAWWSWQVAGRATAPGLRVGFAAGAGLAPVHHERFKARGGRPFAIDPGLFVDTSSYSRQGVDSLVRVLGIDAIVLGSDRPYGLPADPDLGEAALAAFRIENPRRLLEGARR